MKLSVDRTLVFAHQPLELQTQADGSVLLALYADGTRITCLLEPAEATKNGLTLIQCGTIGSAVRSGRIALDEPKP